MHLFRYLALAPLVLTAAFLAPFAPAEAKDSCPALAGGIIPPADPPSLSPPVAAAVSPESLSPPDSLPDDPSADLPQDTASQQPTQSGPSGPLPTEEQLKIQEKQRVFGVMAAFNTTLNRDALPLSSGQKFRLFFKSQTDPWPFGLAAYVAGYNQATDSPKEYGQGMEGYAKRYGAAYSDAFIGNLFGNAILTSWWHEDPRYFQKGTGSGGSRALWAASSTVWSCRDNGTWGPNYANVVGNLIGAAISNVYYPESERTVGDTVTRGLTVSVEGIVGAEVIEFWPDMVRHYQRKKAEKLAKRTEEGGHAVVVYFMYYNFCRVYKTLRVTPAMEAGLTDHVWDITELVALLPAPTPKKRGPYKKRQES